MQEWIPVFAVAAFGAIVTLLTWLMGRARTKRRAKILAQLSQQWGGQPVHQVIGLGYATPMQGFDVTVDGRPAVVFAHGNGKYDTFGFQLAVGEFPLATFRRETGLDRLGRALRLNREIQTGDREFDREVYIETDDDESAIRAMLESEATRSAIRKAASHGTSLVTSRQGVGVTAYMAPKQTPQERFNAALPDVEAVAAVLRSTGGRGVRARARGDIGAPVAFFAMFGAYVLYLSAQWTKPDVWEPWMNADAKRTEHIGLWAVLALLVLAYLWTRGHSRSLRNFLMIAIFGGLSVGGITPLALWMLNAGLDHSAVVPHETTVISKYTRSGRSYTHHILRFHALFDPKETSALDVPSDFYRATDPGARIRVNLRDGAFGWKWVSSVERVPPGG